MAGMTADLGHGGGSVGSGTTQPGFAIHMQHYYVAYPPSYAGHPKMDLAHGLQPSEQPRPDAHMGRWHKPGLQARSLWHVTANEAEVAGAHAGRQPFDTRQDTPPSAFRV